MIAIPFIYLFTGFTSAISSSPCLRLTEMRFILTGSQIYILVVGAGIAANGVVS